MLGWYISVYRLPKAGYKPAEKLPKQASCIARWEADVEGTRWLDNLVQKGRALVLSEFGYPDRYTARATDILPILRSGPPFEQLKRPLEEFLTTPPTSDWRGGFDAAAADACQPNEWLVIEVWDQS